MIPADFPSLHLTSADGARASIALDGGHVTSWIPANERDNRLFVSTKSGYGPGKAIRGGIPVIFPQFGSFGPLAQHGFARLCRWDVVESTPDRSNRTLLRLIDMDQTRSAWPHAFAADLSIVVSGADLTVTMTIRNTDTSPFACAAALHPYFSMRDAFTTRVEGLCGSRYRDSLLDGKIVMETAPELRITGPLDRIYYDAPDRLVIRDGGRSLIIEKTGFTEAVVWNPGAAGTRARSDFAEGEENRMLCVEAAAIQHPIVLAPGESWTGTQRMTTA